MYGVKNKTMNKETIDFKTVSWKLHRELPADFDVYVSDWYCQDNDGAELNINKDNDGFELECFSGIPASSIHIDIVDFSRVWQIAYKDINIGDYDYKGQCFMLANYFCSLFCELIDTTNFKNT